MIQCLLDIVTHLKWNWGQGLEYRTELNRIWYVSWGACIGLLCMCKWRVWIPQLEFATYHDLPMSTKYAPVCYKLFIGWQCSSYRVLVNNSLYSCKGFCNVLVPVLPSAINFTIVLYSMASLIFVFLVFLISGMDEYCDIVRHATCRIPTIFSCHTFCLSWMTQLWQRLLWTVSRAFMQYGSCKMDQVLHAVDTAGISYLEPLHCRSDAHTSPVLLVGWRKVRGASQTRLLCTKRNEGSVHVVFSVAQSSCFQQITQPCTIFKSNMLGQNFVFAKSVHAQSHKIYPVIHW